MARIPSVLKKTTLIFLSFASAAAGIFWWMRAEQASKQAGVDRQNSKLIVRAEKRDIDFTVEISGDVAPAFQLEVKPEVGGKLKAINIEPGSTVKEGDVLVEIDDHDLLSERATALTEIEGAQLQIDQDQKNFVRAKELYEAKLISREVFDNLGSKVALAENSLSKSQRRLQIVDDRMSKTKVIAPMDGTILTMPVVEGQVVIAAASVNNGTTLATIANLSKLLVEVHINQVDVARLSLNQRVKLEAQSLKDATMNATISFIAPVATVKSNLKGFQIQALIEKPDPRLKPGMTVTMEVPIARADNAVTVPIAAVFKGDGKSKIVYVRNGDSTVRREVKVGVTNLDYVQILTGITEGEEIFLVEPDRVAEDKS